MTRNDHKNKSLVLQLGIRANYRGEAMLGDEYLVDPWLALS